MNADKIISAAFCMVISLGSCEEDTSQAERACTQCAGKEIVESLSEEPAYVRKGCFEHIGRVDAFYFVLANRHDDVFGLFPCSEMPEEYRVEDLPVLISGDITSCTEVGGCVEPDVKLASVNVFELAAIKPNAQPSCDSVVAIDLFNDPNASRSSAAATPSSGNGVMPKLDLVGIEQIVAIFELAYGETKTVCYRDEMYPISILSITDAAQATCSGADAAARNKVEVTLSIARNDTLYQYEQMIVENSFARSVRLETCRAWRYRGDGADVYEVRDSIVKWKHETVYMNDFVDKFFAQFGGTYLVGRPNLRICMAKANSMDRQVPKEQCRFVFLIVQLNS
ncbi:MAG: hypothetical protein LBK18_02905 [Prevotellaceae bacterium]|jgi:hypothetical protein|nr:hypothetical protein [Prevotellaceae bacterium]